MAGWTAPGRSATLRPMAFLGTPAPARLDLGKVLLLLAFVTLGLLFWDSPLLTPVKLLVVMGHESGHAVATLLAGGKVQRVVLSPDQSGACLSALPSGAWRTVVVYSAGYVGSAVAGAVLLVLAFRFNLARGVLAAYALWLAAVAVLVAGSLFTVVYCLGMAALLGAAARWLPLLGVRLTALFLASFTGLYALFDLRDDLWNAAVRAQSDAALLAAHTPVPALVWAGLWTLLSVLILGWGALLALRSRPAAHSVLAPTEDTT
ncbi:MAG: M50 family metallopeptidase [Myxococcaceae bacterium]